MCFTCLVLVSKLHYTVAEQEVVQCVHCLQKCLLPDYGSALPCLQSATDWATVVCKPNCSRFENDSRSYLDRNFGINNTADVMQLMGADCR